MKADKKMLMGTSLENALDPLGDHSYQLSSIRSHPGIVALGTATVGVSPNAGRVWTNRPSTFAAFEIQIAALFDRLDARPATPTAFNFLSQPVLQAAGVERAYALAVLPAALVDHDPNPVAAVIQEANVWAYEATPSRVKRFQQLNALVLTGRLAAMAVGATFKIIASA